MPDTKISDLTAVTSLDGTEELPIVQSASTMKVTTQQLGGTVLYNDVVNDTVTSATGTMETFDLGSTVSVPTMAIGDRIEVEMHFKTITAPASNGFGLYFLWHNIKYTPPSASTPTYGNSFIQMPNGKESSSLNITITRISSTDIFVQYEQKLNTLTVPNAGDAYFNGGSWQYQDTLDTDTATRFEVQAFVSAGGELELEYLYIKHTK